MSEMKTLTINGRSYTVADPDAAHIDDSAVGKQAWSSHRIMEEIKKTKNNAPVRPGAGEAAVVMGEAEAAGNYSVAEGLNTKAQGKASHSEGKETVAFGELSHAEGVYGIALGGASHAEGRTVLAGSNHSHAEGSDTVTGNFKRDSVGNFLDADGNITTDINRYVKVNESGRNAHAEGSKSSASGDNSHAEGGSAQAAGANSHAEGARTRASNSQAHAEGLDTVASGNSAHAEGNGSIAAGGSSHAEGRSTIAGGYCQHVQGKYNREDTSNMYAHIVGNGTEDDRSNAFTLSWGGYAYFAGSVSGPGADYAEYFEWLDGNPESEDRVGLIVALEGDKIRPAKSGEDMLGVVSGTAMVVGDNAEWEWQGKYLCDDYGRVLWDTVGEFDEDGVSVGVFPRRKINPDYDPNRQYVRRVNRPEWDTVGLVGKLYVTDDGTCVVGGYAGVGRNGVATASIEKTNMRVMKRIRDNIVQVFMK